jgi:hypothetical protein
VRADLRCSSTSRSVNNSKSSSTSSSISSTGKLCHKAVHPAASGKGKGVKALVLLGDLCATVACTLAGHGTVHCISYAVLFVLYLSTQGLHQ